MNDKIMEAAGFGEHVKLVRANKCPVCKKPINMADFTDSTSRKEYRISGLCQICQNDIFEPTPDKTLTFTLDDIDDESPL